MYKNIYHPVTKKKYKLNTHIGMKILRKFIIQSGGCMGSNCNHGCDCPVLYPNYMWSSDKYSIGKQMRDLNPKEKISFTFNYPILPQGSPPNQCELVV